MGNTCGRVLVKNKWQSVVSNGGRELISLVVESW